MPGFLKAKRAQTLEGLDKAESTIQAVDEGTYDTGSWSASSFSGSPTTAAKTARSDGSRMPTRSFQVVEIDQ